MIFNLDNTMPALASACSSSSNTIDVSERKLPLTIFILFLQVYSLAKQVIVTVWGCFWGTTLGYLYAMIEGSVTRLIEGRYRCGALCGILEQSLPQVTADMGTAGISNPAFMQETQAPSQEGDNSPIRNSYRALIWLQEAG